MSSRTPRRFYRSTSFDDLPQVPPRKRPGYWLNSPPRSSANYASSSSIQVSAVANADSSLVERQGAFTEPIRKKRRLVMLGVDMEEKEQVTRDLCTSLQNEKSTAFGKVDVVPWRSSSDSPNGMDLQQSGTSSEEDLMRDGNDNDTADTIRTAAEMLTQLTHGKNGDSNGQFPDSTKCGPHSQDTGQDDGERPIRWGLKKKISYETRRSVDSCDLGLCTGLIRKFSYDQERAPGSMTANTPEQKSEVGRDSGRQEYRSSVISWDQSSPHCQASSAVYGDRRSSGEGGMSSRHQNFQASKEKQNGIPSTSRTCPGNILKLPKEMQGRWSCERYKTAQLKLIDIMHARKAAPGKPILRPALREEARKHIGDTGLLDHLLKHMTDTVVSTGERFRRRHNSEGAMEYWLEHASLMELRKAAGIEDPSWIPPAGWKAGDKLPDRNWQFNRGMTLAEAAEMKNLKETVERLKSDVKVLCGSIKVSNQRGVLTSLSISHQKQLEDLPETADEEENLRQERKSLKENSSAIDNPADIASEIQDVRKVVAVMQAEVSQVINTLGIVPPIKATPVRYQLDASIPGNPMPLMISAGDETCSITYRMSPESQPPGTSEPALNDFVFPKLDAPMRQCFNVKNGIHRRNGGNMVDISAPFADGLSQALSNYKQVNQPGQLSAHSRVNEKMIPKESSMSSHICLPPGTASFIHGGDQDFNPMFTSQPTGFRICRPPGSFVWPSMMNFTQALSMKNPPMSRREQAIQFRRLEDGSGDSSSRQVSGIPMASPMVHVKQANFSMRSLAESQVAATMATMFGCMAMAPQFSVPTPPLMMTSIIDTSAKETLGTATSNSGQCSSPAEQSNPALSLSLSLSVSSGISQGISPALKKQKSI